MRFSALFGPLTVAYGLVLGSVLFCCGSAAAAPSKKVDALGKFEEGSREAAAGRYQRALAAFRISMELEPSPNTRFKIAKCHQALGQIGSAYKNFRRSAEEALDRVNATGDPRYSATREAALAATAALDRDVPRLTVIAPADATPDLSVTIDSELVPPGMFGSPVEVDPGERVVVATGPRVQRFERRIKIARGKKQSIELALVRMPTAVMQISFANRPVGISLTVDEQPLAPELFERPLYVNPGPHRLTATAPGYRQFVFARQLEADEKVQVEVALRPSSDPRKTACLSLAGAAVVALAVGIGAGAAAQSADSGQQQIDPLLRESNERDRIRTLAIVSDSAFGVAGALAGTALVLGLVSRWRDPPPPTRRSVSLLPWAGRSGAGLSAHLEF